MLILWSLNIFLIFFKHFSLLYLIPFFLLHIFLLVIVKIICILVSVAYFTIAERKIMASIQRRLGPNIEGGFFGLLQPLFDGLKLFIKEIVLPSRAITNIFLLSPILVFILSLISWSIIPFFMRFNLKPFLIFDDLYSRNLFTVFIADINCGIFFLLALSSLNVYGIILGGWASNSKYAFLGALRSSAQMISYEVSLGITILPVILLTGSFNLTDIIFIQEYTIWYCLPLLPSVFIFFISMLAETNRAPFDLPEAEAELVAGYNVEYGAIIFALFFLGEYSNMLLMSCFINILFFGGWLFPLAFLNAFFFFFHPFIFSLKIVCFCFLYIWIRAAFPRFRYDQLMDIGWKKFLPLMLSFFIFICSLLFSLNLQIVNNFNFLFGWSC